jgi:hypothetical protein
MSYWKDTNEIIVASIWQTALGEVNVIHTNSTRKKQLQLFRLFHYMSKFIAVGKLFQLASYQKE